MNNKETLHIYTRVSGLKQVEKYSLEAQRLEGIKKAEQLKMDFQVHVEPGRSAKYETIENRPVLQNLMYMADDGLVKHVFVCEQDRLSRNKAVQSTITIQFQKQGILLHTISQTFDFSDTESVFMADLLAIISARENTLKVRRSVRSMHLRVREGKWGGGVMLPYGYMKDKDGRLIINEKEKEIYLYMVDLCMKGIGTKSIATKLNEMEIQTRGKTALIHGTKKVNRYTGAVTQISNEEFIWKGGTVYCILSNTIYKGERKYKGETINAPPLLSMEKWDDLQVSLRKRGKLKQNSFFFLLKGLIRCGKCGANFYGRTRRSKKDHYYMCSSKRESTKNCGTRSIGIDKLDLAVWLTIMKKTDFYMPMLEREYRSGSRATALIGMKEELKKVQQQLEESRQRKVNLIMLFESGRIDFNIFDERNSQLVEVVQQLQNEEQLLLRRMEFLTEQQELPWIPYYGNLLTKHGHFTSMEDRRRILLQVVKNITITYEKEINCHHIQIDLNIPDVGEKTINTEVYPDTQFVTYVPPKLAESHR